MTTFLTSPPGRDLHVHVEAPRPQDPVLAIARGPLQAGFPSKMEPTNLLDELDDKEPGGAATRDATSWAG